MADRYRRPDIPNGVTCPQCEAIGDVGRTHWTGSVWLCGLCTYESNQLVHWLTPGATRRLHTAPDTFGDNPEYVERQDVMSGKAWWQREVNGNNAVRRSRRARIYQVAYTDIQYQLIRWSLWKLDEGWTVGEVYEVLKYFWPQEFGQTPLVSRTVGVWRNNRTVMEKRGLEWP